MSTLKRLPAIRPHASIHPTSGLITSPLAATIPDPSAKDPYDYSLPRVLADHNIWLAFFARFQDQEGWVLGRLDVSNQELRQKVGRDPEMPTKYRLSSTLMSTWHSLEKSLVALGTRLYCGHPNRDDFPFIHLPRFPSRYGYTRLHETKDEAYSAARRSRDAFQFLIAFVSFTVALWLTEYEHDCLDEAFAYLQNNETGRVPGSFLDTFKLSVMCDFAPGIRPGAFLDPYITRWSPFFDKFTRANVPIWLLWGPEIEKAKTIEPIDPKVVRYFPPDQVLFDALKRAGRKFEAIPLPTPIALNTSQGLDGTESDSDNEEMFVDEYDAGAPDAGAPDAGGPDAGAQGEPELSEEVKRARAADVNPGSGQRPGETHWEMLRRLQENFERYLLTETEVQKQRRLNWEKANKRWFTESSTVYTWEQDDVYKSFWKRRKLTKREREDEFGAALRWQRVYWSNTNSWDLQLFRDKPPSDYKKPTVWDGDSDDDDSEPYGFMERPSAMPEPASPERLDEIASRAVASDVLSTVRESPKSAGQQHGWYSLSFQNLVTHLKTRFGFNAEDPIAFTSALTAVSDAERQKAFTEARKVLLRFSQNEDVSVATELAVALFAGTSSHLDLDSYYTNMQWAWDFRSTTFRPTNRRLQVQKVRCTTGPEDDKPLYVLRPAKPSAKWFVATTSASVVLLVFRQEWASSIDIAGGLLELGFSFNTVVERRKTAEEMEMEADKARKKELAKAKEMEMEMEMAKARAKAKEMEMEMEEGEVGVLVDAKPKRRGGRKGKGTDTRPEQQHGASADDEPEVLGVRPFDFKPDADDYTAYLAARRQVLLSSKGRAIRLAGGVVGRIAAEVVSDERVMSGPTACDTIIGVSDDMVYADDGANAQDFNIVSGVYSVLREQGSGRSSQRSWFPTHSIWLRHSGLGDYQWSPDAESWYKKRVEKQIKSYDLPKTTEWKAAIKFRKNASLRIRLKNEELAAAFIEQNFLN